MHLDAVLAYSALAAGVVLLVTAQDRILPLVATAAALLAAAVHAGYLRAHLAGFPLLPVLAAALAVPALISWFRSTGKAAITSGAIASFVGFAQLAAWLWVRR